MIHVALVEPEIPQNTGNIARLCAATRTDLHIVGMPGFRLDDRAVRRAGLDYWDEVQLRTWKSFDELQRAQHPDARYFFLTTKAKRPYFEIKFQPADFLVFGRETKGLPEGLLAANSANSLTIPMQGTRSLNLATAVAIVLFEAVRQQRTI